MCGLVYVVGEVLLGVEGVVLFPRYRQGAGVHRLGTVQIGAVTAGCVQTLASTIDVVIVATYTLWGVDVSGRLTGGMAGG